MVVLRCSIWWMICPCGLFFFPIVLEFNVLTVIVSIVGILLLFLFFNHKIIFDDSGITTKNFFNNPEKPTSVSWNAIFSVGCYEGGVRMLSGFQFGSKENGFINITEFWYTNYEESLRYAVRKLPPEVFDVSARKRLSEMGICHLDW